MMVLVIRPRNAIATSWDFGATEFRPGLDPREGRKTEVVSELLWLANGITRIFRSNAQDFVPAGSSCAFRIRLRGNTATALFSEV